MPRPLAVPLCETCTAAGAAGYVRGDAHPPLQRIRIAKVRVEGGRAWTSAIWYRPEPAP